MTLVIKRRKAQLRNFHYSFGNLKSLKVCDIFEFYRKLNFICPRTLALSSKERKITLPKELFTDHSIPEQPCAISFRLLIEPEDKVCSTLITL